jgi:hypothetical protein
MSWDPKRKDGQSGSDWMADRIEAAIARISQLEDALRPFAVYAAKRDEMPMSTLGDSVHTIHGGTEHEAAITLTHCRRARELLEG